MDKENKQNAAESLPAQAEQKLGTCMASFVPHTRGTYCVNWVPAAPVEDKGVCWNGKHHGPHLKADDCARWTNDKKWAALAEPKPTPSFNLREYEVGPSYWTDRVVHFEKVYKCASASFMEAYKAGLLSPNNLDFDEWSSIVEAQTQPDSSSISTKQTLQARVDDLEDLILFLHRQGEQDEHGDMRWNFCLSKHHRSMETALRNWRDYAAKGQSNEK